jgi:cation:H+ antiporter
MLSAVFLFAFNGRIGLVEGVCLLAFFVLFVVYNVGLDFTKKPSTGDISMSDIPKNNKKTVIMQIIALFLLGQILLVFGAWLLVSFGERIAHSINVAESTVAIIFIAIGTGLPELFTAIASIQKKHNGIALGNILGSCILNCTLLLGSSSVISGFNGGLPISNSILFLSIPVMIIATILAVVPIIFTQKTKRLWGVLLVSLYVAYLCVLCF